MHAQHDAAQFFWNDRIGGGGKGFAAIHVEVLHLDLKGRFRRTGGAVSGNQHIVWCHFDIGEACPAQMADHRVNVLLLPPDAPPADGGGGGSLSDRSSSASPATAVPPGPPPFFVMRRYSQFRQLHEQASITALGVETAHVTECERDILCM